MGDYKLVPTELTTKMVEASGCEGNFKVSPQEQAQEMWEAMLAAEPDVGALVEALEQVERWGGFPSTDKTWEGSGEPVSYGAAFGSNGERDFMREVARKALTAYRKGGEK